MFSFTQVMDHSREMAGDITICDLQGKCWRYDLNTLHICHKNQATNFGDDYFMDNSCISMTSDSLM